MFGLPQLTGERVHHVTLRVAMPPAIDGWYGAGYVNKRVIGRDGTVIIDTVNLPVGVIQ